MFAIDFTKSNEWTGKESFQGKNLHYLFPNPNQLNPYEQAITIIGETLSAFDDDGLIPAYGFGCNRSRGDSVFSFNPRDTPCHGFQEVLSRYRQLVPITPLAGPTSFGPLIRHACNIVKASCGQYHILLIVADGQVTHPTDLPKDELSEQEKDTISAIVDACQLPLSIVMVGVGDGPWDVMEEFDDRIPERTWDNFQFVPFNTTLAKAQRSVPMGASPAQVKAQMEATFALHVLMEIPEQYREVGVRGLMSKTAANRAQVQGINVLDPAVPQNVSPQSTTTSTVTTAPVASVPNNNNSSSTTTFSNLCSICDDRLPNVAFDCGHCFCKQCADQMSNCPLCRKKVERRTNLF